MTSGGPRLTVAVSPGVEKRDRDALEDPRALLDDVLGRTGGHRPDVDPRHEHRDERDPPQLLEQREEAEADERVAGELRDVGDGIDAGEREDERESAGAEREHEEHGVSPARASGSASQIAAANAGKTTTA